MDLPKAMEADLFGAAEWALDFLEPLSRVAEGAEGAVLEWRAAANRARFAAEKGEPVPPVPAPPADALGAERAALLDAPDRTDLVAAAEAFVAAYEDRGGTTVDEVLAALTLSNVLRRDHRRAAELFEVAAEELERRVAAGRTGWKESAKSCWFRAMVAYRLTGDEGAMEAARDAADRLGGAGIPPGAFGDSRVGIELGMGHRHKPKP